MLSIILPLIMYLFPNIQAQLLHKNEAVLSTHEISLNNRYPNQSVNEVFKENILLNLAYLRGSIALRKPIVWSRIKEPFTYSLILKPGDVFAFHDDVLPDFNTGKIKTTNAHFNSSEGFKSDGYLVGDGVCHLASLMYWVAKDANITSQAPTNHDFANIPEVPREFGVSIYHAPGEKTANEQQNLYIKNDKNKPIAFVFSYENDRLQVAVKELL